MRGQLSLEMLIVLAALAAAFLMIIDNYNALFNAVLGGIDRVKARYVAELVLDASDGCPSSTVKIRLPFDVELSCNLDGPSVHVGAAEEPLNGLKCIVGGRGRTLKIQGCSVSIT